MFIINPDPYLLPTYRISPFLTSSIRDHQNYPQTDFAYVYFNERFGKGNWILTKNGREGIELALKLLAVDLDNIVSILTTSQNKYISSCVTRSIEKYCSWNRKLDEKTGVIFVNHEFGYPYQEMLKLQSYGRPLIEDCCTTFFSQDKENKIGNYGRYSIYSFPKFFPIQIGGLLVGERVGLLAKEKFLKLASREEESYIMKVIGEELRNADSLLEKRKQIFNYTTEKFKAYGFSLRFPNDEKIVPSALLMNNNQLIKNLESFKQFLNSHGIQSSVFYGEDAFFIPNHQNLTEVDVDYFITVINEFILNQ